MKNTKERILNTALELFNKEGLSKVTLRAIANKMGISQGNLNYHFKKRELIIESLYFQLVDRIDEQISKHENQNIGLASLLSISSMMMESFFEYRFFMLDFVQIIRENDKIKTHYLEVTKRREGQFIMLSNFLVDKEIMRKEVLPNEYVYLFKRFQISSDFWISSAAITESRLNKKMIKEYSNIINQAIFPYLTEKGKKAYYDFVDAKSNCK